jgi:ribosomal protein L29
MKANELRKQSNTALTKLLGEKRADLAEQVVQLHSKEVKNVRAIRSLKKDIARILTIMAEQAQGDQS